MEAEDSASVGDENLSNADEEPDSNEAEVLAESFKDVDLDSLVCLP